jgi:hypothetical protein
MILIDTSSFAPNLPMRRVAILNNMRKQGSTGRYILTLEYDSMDTWVASISA